MVPRRTRMTYVVETGTYTYVLCVRVYVEICIRRTECVHAGVHGAPGVGRRRRGKLIASY
jgi:hypothetical protein